jgi:hypothetical protein
LFFCTRSAIAWRPFLAPTRKSRSGRFEATCGRSHGRFVHATVTHPVNIRPPHCFAWMAERATPATSRLRPESITNPVNAGGASVQSGAMRLRTAGTRLFRRWGFADALAGWQARGGLAGAFARKAALRQPAKGLHACRLACLGGAPVIDCREQWIMQPDHFLTRSVARGRPGFLRCLAAGSFIKTSVLAGIEST